MSDLKHPEQAEESLEQTRHNYTVQAHMDESDDQSYGGQNINKAGRMNSHIAAKQGNKKSINEMLVMNAMINSLADIERNMEKLYGKDFDLHLAAEFFDDETYEKLASIQDIDQRREAVSTAVQDGIENGTIDKEDLEKFNPEFLEWVDKRAENRHEIVLKREQELTQNVDNKTNMTQDSNFDQNAMAVFGIPSS